MRPSTETAPPLPPAELFSNEPPIRLRSLSQSMAPPLLRLELSWNEHPFAVSDPWVEMYTAPPEAALDNERSESTRPNEPSTIRMPPLPVVAKFVKSTPLMMADTSLSIVRAR